MPGYVINRHNSHRVSTKRGKPHLRSTAKKWFKALRRSHREVVLWVLSAVATDRILLFLSNRDLKWGNLFSWCEGFSVSIKFDSGLGRICGLSPKYLHITEPRRDGYGNHPLYWAPCVKRVCPDIWERPEKKYFQFLYIWIQLKVI